MTLTPNRRLEQEPHLISTQVPLMLSPDEISLINNLAGPKVRVIFDLQCQFELSLKCMGIYTLGT